MRVSGLRRILIRSTSFTGPKKQANNHQPPTVYEASGSQTRRRTANPAVASIAASTNLGGLKAARHLVRRLNLAPCITKCADTLPAMITGA